MRYLMKLVIKLLLIPITLFTFNANAANPSFNHKGIQKGATSTSCYHDPCAVTRIMSSEVVKKKPGYTQLKLKAVNGYKGWDDKKTKWDHGFYTMYVNCSLKRPNLASKPNIEGSILPLGIGENSYIPGAEYPDTILYLQACHNYSGETEKGGKKFGYNVKEADRF